MKTNKIVAVFLLFMAIWSCKNDDDVLNGAEVVPPQTLSETVIEDEEKIKAYLQTHFYNYDEFETPPADFDFRINIDTIAGDNSSKTPLIEQMLTKTISVSSNRFSGIDGEDDIQHTFYYLDARSGEGTQPSIADSTYVRFRGSLLDGNVFDGSTEIPVWFDLASIQGGGARGFTEGTAMFKAGGNIIENEDGTFSVENYGIGLIIFPSGLGFFNASQTGIPAYSPLIFEIDLFVAIESDHDQDGIPSIQEDVNGNGFLLDEEDDTDGNLVPNYFDTDDDGDGILTREEIEIDENGNITFPDTDGDGTPDYLDSDS